MKRFFFLVMATLLLSTFAFADIDGKSLMACKFSRAGTPCEVENDCPAFRVMVTVAPHTLGVVAGLYVFNPNSGELEFIGESTGKLPLPEALTYIIYLPIPAGDCPTGAVFAIYWLLDETYVVFDAYQCGNPDLPVNCDAADEEEAPAIDLTQLLK